MMDFISHRRSLWWQVSVYTINNILAIFSHQVYLCGSLQAYWARCNEILGESASIDAWEHRETPYLNSA